MISFTINCSFFVPFHSFKSTSCSRDRDMVYYTYEKLEYRHDQIYVKTRCNSLGTDSKKLTTGSMVSRFPNLPSFFTGTISNTELHRKTDGSWSTIYGARSTHSQSTPASGTSRRRSRNHRCLLSDRRYGADGVLSGTSHI